MFPKITIGAPIRGREEVLPFYFAALEKLDYPKECLDFFFVVNNSNTRVMRIVADFCSTGGKDACYVVRHFPGLPPNVRINKNRIKIYPALAEMRNQIISWAEGVGSDYLFFLDSDIIVKPDTLKRLISHNKDCVAALIKNDHQEADSNSYNFLDFDEGHNAFVRLSKRQLKGLIRVDLTGAAMLLSREAFLSGKYYSVDDKTGEDNGFALDMMDAGILMFVDADYQLYHVFDPENYDRNGVKFS